jgi:hypothetical protein
MKTQIKAVVKAIVSHVGGEYTYSEVKELIETVESEFGYDFEVSFDGRDYRIIENSEIESVMKDELSNDEYILGCFNAWFLADVMSIPAEAIEKIQAADCHEALGMIIAANDEMLSELVKKYISADGAGHHFSRYDGSEEDTGEYTVFCVG